MKRFQLTLDKNHELRIPSDILEELLNAPGSVLEVQIDGSNTLFLKSIVANDSLVEKDGILVHTGVPVGDIESVITEQREARMQELGFIPPKG